VADGKKDNMKMSLMLYDCTLRGADTDSCNLCPVTISFRIHLCTT